MYELSQRSGLGWGGRRFVGRPPQMSRHVRIARHTIRPMQLTQTGLGFSLKPPKIIRKAVKAVVKNVTLKRVGIAVGAAVAVVTAPVWLPVVAAGAGAVAGAAGAVGGAALSAAGAVGGAALRVGGAALRTGGGLVTGAVQRLLPSGSYGTPPIVEPGPSWGPAPEIMLPPPAAGPAPYIAPQPMPLPGGGAPYSLDSPSYSPAAAPAAFESAPQMAAGGGPGAGGVVIGLVALAAVATALGKRGRS